jgi:LPS export ABC transporter permease LptG/LPS export ABC transporter permease LptF
MTSAALVHPGPKHRHPRWTLYRYVGREALVPTLVFLLGLTVVVLTTRLLEFSELVINRGVSLADVCWILFLEGVPVAGRMFPFAVLVGSLVALGRMGADREILALESSGVAPARLVWPVVSFALVMATAALLLGVYATPWSNRTLDDHLGRLSRQTPWANLRAGQTQSFGGWQLEAREVSPSGKQLRGVLLWMPELGETIFAQEGSLGAAPDGSVRITLRQGSVVLRPDDGVRQLRFGTLGTTLPATEAIRRKERLRLLGLRIDELAARAREWVPTPEDALPRAALELHRRFALPAATVVFGFLAVPLFLTRAQYSRSGGGVLGVVCTIVYYGLVQLSEGLVQAGTVGAATAAWLPNVVLACVAVVLLGRALRERVLGQRFERRSRRWRRTKSDEAAAPARHDTEPRIHRYPLPRYVAWRFLQLVGLSFSVLFVAYLLIDVMDRLDWFAEHGATGTEAMRFYGARVPLLASRAVPMSILVATALTVSLLAVEGELIGARACGIPAPRALAPVLVIALLIAPLYFLWNNLILPRTNALADELKRTEIKDKHYERIEARRKASVWHRSGSHVIEAARFDTQRGDAREITIYELGENGLPTSRTDASAGRHIGRGVWRLLDPSRVEIHNGTVRQVAPMRFADLGETVDAEVDTMHMSVADVAREVRDVEESGHDATWLRVDYHVKLADPLACVVLPAVVLFFAVTGPPFPGPAQTLLVSGIIGVAYILATGVAASLGHGGRLPPAVGGWVPVLAFAILAVAFASRMWRRM